MKTLWIETVWPVLKEHPLETIGAALGLVKVGFDIKDAVSGNGSSERSSGIGASNDYTSSDDRITDFSDFDAEETVDDIFTDEEDDECEVVFGSPKRPHPRKGYLGHRWKKNEDGVSELTETWISPAKIHSEQMDDDESEDD